MMNLFKNLKIKIICIVFFGLNIKIKCADFNFTNLIVTENQAEKTKEESIEIAEKTKKEESIEIEINSKYDEKKNKRVKSYDDFYKKKINNLQTQQKKMQEKFDKLQEIKNFSNKENFKDLIIFYKECAVLETQIKENFEEILNFNQNQKSKIQNDIENAKMVYESTLSLLKNKNSKRIKGLNAVVASAKNELAQYDKNNEKFSEYQNIIDKNIITKGFSQKKGNFSEKILNKIPHIKKKIKNIIPKGKETEYKEIIIEVFGDYYLKQWGKLSFFDFFQKQYINNIINRL